jgi:pilus assembly protein Flp/PilA
LFCKRIQPSGVAGSSAMPSQPNHFVQRRSLIMLYPWLSLLKIYFPELKREEGQGMAEYALIIALVAILLVTALGVLRGGISGVFDDIVAAF